jgi:hypothetical protein
VASSYPLSPSCGHKARLHGHSMSPKRGETFGLKHD